MFTDVGNTDLKEKCLDVIKELKLEADLLMQENYKSIGEAAANWKFEEAEERKRNNPVLAKVEEMGQTVGDADSEALGKLQEELTALIEQEVGKLRAETEEGFKRLRE